MLVCYVTHVKIKFLNQHLKEIKRVRVKLSDFDLKSSILNNGEAIKTLSRRSRCFCPPSTQGSPIIL